MRDPQREPFWVKALTTKSLLKLKSVRLDPHDPDDTCCVHTPAVCLSARELGSSSAWGRRQAIALFVNAYVGYSKGLEMT